MYRDSSGKLIQLLPNPHRAENYFNGGVTYEIPATGDLFELAVTPPLGREQISLYASTSPLGEIDTQDVGSIYLVTTPGEDLGRATRGVEIRRKSAPGAPGQDAAEFVESITELKTVP